MVFCPWIVEVEKQTDPGPSKTLKNQTLINKPKKYVSFSWTPPFQGAVVFQINFLEFGAGLFQSWHQQVGTQQNLRFHFLSESTEFIWLRKWGVSESIFTYSYPQNPRTQDSWKNFFVRKRQFGWIYWLQLFLGYPFLGQKFAQPPHHLCHRVGSSANEACPAELGDLLWMVGWGLLRNQSESCVHQKQGNLHYVVEGLNHRVTPCLILQVFVHFAILAMDGIWWNT